MLPDLYGDSNMLLQWSLVSIVVILVYTVYLNVRNRKLPPHQFILPLVGNLLSLGKRRPAEVVESLRAADGTAPKMSSFVFPSFTIITVNDLVTGKKVFLQQSDLTSDRPEDYAKIMHANCVYGFVCSSSPMWIHTRRISVQILRELGLGKSVVQQSVEEQCAYLQRVLKDFVGVTDGVNISLTLTRCASDITSMLLFGLKPAIEGDASIKYAELVDKFFGAQVVALNVFPSLRYLAPFFPFLRKKEEALAEIMTHLKEVIQKHREQLDKANEPNDFIDHFLLLQEKEKSQRKVLSATSPYCDENLAMSLFDLFLAGTDTTSVTLTWAIALLCHKPHIQEKVHQELIDVFGEADFANMNQMNDCPYTRAVLSEVLRFGATAPNTLPHTATKDLMIDDYWIPKGCVLFLNIFSLCRDPNVWKYPNEFHPEHFYDAEKNLYLPNENLLSFGLGKRICPGETLARQELFLFFAAMFLKFRFEFHEKSVLMVEQILSGIDEGLIRRANPYFVNVYRIN